MIVDIENSVSILSSGIQIKGMSGSPVFNGCGRMIGIAVSSHYYNHIHNSHTIFDSLGVGIIPISYIHKLVVQIIIPSHLSSVIVSNNNHVRSVHSNPIVASQVRLLYYLQQNIRILFPNNPYLGRIHNLSLLVIFIVCCLCSIIRVVKTPKLLRYSSFYCDRFA